MDLSPLLLANVTSYAYDHDGRLTSVTQPNPSTGGATGGLVTTYVVAKQPRRRKRRRTGTNSDVFDDPDFDELQADEPDPANDTLTSPPVGTISPEAEMKPGFVFEFTSRQMPGVAAGGAVLVSRRRCLRRLPTERVGAGRDARARCWA